MRGLPLISVVITTYKQEKFIGKTIESVLSQGVDDLEILILDDCSPDATQEVVAKYLDDERVQYVRHSENLGDHGNNALALTKGRGKYMVWLHGDDYLLPGHLRSYLDVMEAHPECALIYSPCYWVDENERILRLARHRGHPDFNYVGGRNEVAELLAWDNYITPSSVMFRQADLDSVGTIDPDTKCYDWDLFIRMAIHNPDFAYLNTPSTAYRICSGQGSNAFYASVDPLITHLHALNTAFESDAKGRLWEYKTEIAEHLERRIRSYGSEEVLPYSGSIKTACAQLDSIGMVDLACDLDVQPLVSVIVPTKDRPDLLQDTLRSINEQGYQNWEVVVVNDGGEDVEAMVRALDCYNRFRYVQHKTSRGLPSARNTGIRLSRGDILCYLDDDDTFRPQHLDTVVDALARSEASLVYTEAEYIQEQVEEGIRNELGRSQPYSGIEYSKDRLHVANYIPVNTWAHRRELLSHSGLFDVELNAFEDWDLLIRFSRLVGFVHIPEVTVDVHMRPSSGHDQMTQRERKDFLPLYRKLYERYPVDSSDAKAARKRQLQALEQDRQMCGNDSEYAEDRDSPAHISGKLQVQFLREQFLRRVGEFGYVLPSIHLIMVDIENDVAKIADTIDSLEQQIYAGWGLSVISTAPPPHGDFDALPMLEWIQSEDVGQSFVDTVRKSACDWVAPVMPGDTFEPEALSVFVDYINRNPGWKFIYSDEDCVDVSGNQVNHKFKPDINTDYLCSCPYTGNLSLVHRDMLEQLSSDIGIPAALFYDLALKVLENHGVAALGHIPTLLYHQLQENECREERDNWVKPVLEAYIERNNIDADVLAGTAAGTCLIDYRCSGAPGVCIAIYAGSDLVKMERSVASLLNKTTYSNWTIRLGVDRAFASQLEKYQGDSLSVDLLDKDTSRCAYFDSLAQTVDVDYMVFVDPGVVVLQDSWLERMLSQGQRPEIGVVGVRLLSPQKRIAHAGILTGIGSFGVGGCIGEGDTLEQEGYMQRFQVVQNLSAVSSACMLVNRSLFQSLQGFDAGIDVQLYRDVDFCLRVGEAGKRIVWTPFVTMLISDERLDTYAGDGGESRIEQDARQLTSRWLENFARDPAYNRNLTLKRADFSLETGFKPAWDPAIRDVPRIIGGGAGSYSSWAYRVAQPLESLSSAGRASCSHIPFKGDSVEHLPSTVEMERIQPDVLLMHNTVHDHFLDAFRQYKEKNNILLVFGQDDLMFAVPPKSSCFKLGYKDIKKRVRTCLSLADRLVVTGEPLADELSGFISDIRIVPNRLDARIWGALESRRGCGLKPRVGWAGAMQHHGDLQVLADAVRETAAEVDWIFMGMCPDFLRPYVKEVHEYVAFSTYPETLAKLNLDLAVAPLERNRFNRCKSDLRILEYGAMGWPVIATDIEPYRDAPVHLVSNQTRAWVDAIREHVHDLDANWKAGDALRAWVRENRLLQGHLDDWVDALDPAGNSHHQSLIPSKASGL